jgi:hypothetical protein
MVREQRKKDGKCIVCGKNEPIPGEYGCDYCYSSHQEYIESLQTDRRMLGFCIQCGDLTDVNKITKKHFSRCKKHRDAQNKKLKLRRKKKAV